MKTTSPFGRNLTDDNLFNIQGAYVNGVVTNKTAWGIPDTAVNPLVARRAEYEPLYHKSQDKNTRTKTDVVAHRRSRKVYENELRTFHNEWIAGNTSISVEEKLILGGREKDIEPTPRGKISSVPIIGLKPVGGGSIEVRARVTTDQTRFSMHKLADAIECKFVFVPAGEMPPEDPDACAKTVVSKKARFIIPCGVKNAGQSFFGFFRWVNQSIPANSGDWTTKALGAVIA